MNGHGFFYSWDIYVAVDADYHHHHLIVTGMGHVLWILE